MNVTANFFLLRWVGNLHETDQQRLMDWSTRIATWLNSGLRQAYVFTHQVVAPEAAKSATLFEELLHERYPAPLSVRSPKPLVDDGPSNIQIELFG